MLSTAGVVKEWLRKPPLPYARQNPASPTSKGLQLRALCNEGDGRNVYDISGQGNHGTFVNEPAFVNDPIHRMVVQLDGVNDYIDFGNPASLNFGTGNFTIAIWVKVDSATIGDDRPIFNKAGFSGPAGFDLFWRGGTNDFSYWTGSANDFLQPVAGVWYHIVIVRTGTGTNETLIYVNGVQVATCTDSRNLSNSAACRIGEWNDGGGTPFPGYISDPRAYGRALNVAEVWQIYTKPYRDIKPRVWGLVGVVSGDITIPLTPATSNATSVGATPVLGSVGVSVSPAASNAAAIGATPVLGSLGVTPAPATADGAAVDPGVVLGSLSVALNPAEGNAITVDPSVVLGSVLVTPAPAAADAATVDPTVVAGGDVNVTPDPAASTAITMGATPALGSLGITPAPATADGAAVGPAVVLGSINIAPAPAASSAGTVNPTLLFGSINVVLAPLAAEADTFATVTGLVQFVEGCRRWSAQLRPVRFGESPRPLRWEPQERKVRWS